MSDTALPKEIEKVRVSTIEGLDSLDFTNFYLFWEVLHCFFSNKCWERDQSKSVSNSGGWSPHGLVIGNDH